MCGIAGVWTRGGAPVDVPALTALRDAMRRRGPDDAGLWVDGDVGLAHRRLSIVDLSRAGRQPLANEDGHVRVVFNGEVYNHEALRAALEARGHRFVSRTDTEVLAHGYEEWGAELPARLNGMFAFAIWDGARRRLLLARDRLGVKPLYVLRVARLLAFASEVQALAAVYADAVSVDWRTIDAYLHFGFVPQELGLYREIEALPPGHVLEVSERGESLHRYWALTYETGSQGGSPAWASEVRRVLADAVARRLVADVPVGLLLSGGVDSSVVAALARTLGAEPQAFTIGFAGTADSDGDLEAARAVARHLGLPHRERLLGPEAAAALDVLVGAFGMPFGDPSAIPTYHAGRLAADHGHKVVLAGDGGDEVFGGYANAQAAYVGWLCRRLAGRVPGGRAVLAHASTLDAAVPSRPRILHRMTTLLRYASGLAAGTRWTNGWHGAALRALRGPALRAVCDDEDEDALLLRHAQAAEGADDVARVMHADLAVILPGAYLVKVDVALMATSVEARSPFLDVEAIELGARIPPGVKLSPLRAKHLLKRVALDLGLPARPMLRRKRGFDAPIAAWLRGPLRERARDCILGSLPGRGVVEDGAVRRVWEAHQGGHADHAAPLWILLCLELWFRACVDRHAERAVGAGA